MTEPSDSESTAMQFALEMEDVLSRGYGELGTPWRLAAERKTVGIGESTLYLTFPAVYHPPRQPSG